MEEKRSEDILIEERLRKSMEKEPVPESLSPENIEKLLSREKKPGRYWKKTFAVLAAAAVLCAGTVAALSQWGGMRENTDRKITGKEVRVAVSSNNKEETSEVLEGITVAENYKQMFELLERNYERKKRAYDYEIKSAQDGTVGGMAEEYEVAYDMSYSNEASSDSTKESAASSEDYSTTNIQVEGVQEADQILTDGQYLYLLDLEADKVFVVQPDAQKNTCKKIGEIQLSEESMDAQEIYLWDQKLVIVGSCYERAKQPFSVYEGTMLEDRANGDYGTVQIQSFALTYDVTDPENPVKKGEVMMDGGYISSRLTDGYLYLFAQQGDFYGRIERMESKEDYESCIPTVGGEKIKPDDIYIPEIEQADSILIGSSVSLENADVVKDQFACMMYGTEYYISRENIYLAQEDGNGTRIIKLSYRDGEMEPRASGHVNGVLNDRFSMDEYKGCLRLVTTVYTRNDINDITTWEDASVNNLFVLDENLNQAGSIENLAPGESIYSARFMGEVGYFVTYREVDPLFSVDLSDPNNPRILGELKISGFSEYLHPYGENRLLGIGWETTSNGRGGVKKDGMKLSMFDTADLSDVKESSKLVLEDVAYTEAVNDHRAVLINVEKNLFGFFVETEGNGLYEFCYRTYRYEEGQGFVPVTDTILPHERSYAGVRSVYIGQRLYISNGKTVWTVSLEDGSLLDTLKLE